MKYIYGIILFISINISSYAQTKILESINNALVFTQENKVRIGSFNIEIFGQTKLGRPNVLTVLALIVSTYDLLAIEEVGSNYSSATDLTCEKIIQNFVFRINEIVGSDAYEYYRGSIRDHF